MIHRLVVLGVGLCSAALAQERYQPERPAVRVVQRDEVWRDDGRMRDVPVRVYTPDGLDTNAPLIVFSHGMGGTREGYGYICSHLASHGNIVVVPTHTGSDAAGVREDAKELARRPAERGMPLQGLVARNTSDPDNLRNRPRDISFVIDRALADPALAKLVDAERIGVAGHSFGAYTAMAVAGMTVDLPEGRDRSFRDARVKAVLPMSPQGRGAMGVDAGAWDGVAAPVFFLTGTEDYGQGERSEKWRREAFDAVSGVDAYLMVLDGGTHSTFGGRDRLNRRHRQHIELIESAATAFFDAKLREDPTAAAWLKATFGVEHKDCTAEFRPAKPVK
jgi:predicted dienelactone hydrolase